MCTRYDKIKNIIATSEFKFAAEINQYISFLHDMSNRNIIKLIDNTETQSIHIFSDELEGPYFNLLILTSISMDHISLALKYDSYLRNNKLQFIEVHNIDITTNESGIIIPGFEFLSVGFHMYFDLSTYCHVTVPLDYCLSICKSKESISEWVEIQADFHNYSDQEKLFISKKLNNNNYDLLILRHNKIAVSSCLVYYEGDVSYLCFGVTLSKYRQKGYLKQMYTQFFNFAKKMNCKFSYTFCNELSILPAIEHGWLLSSHVYCYKNKLART